MNIEDFSGEGLEDGTPHNSHEAGERHQFDMGRDQLVGNLFAGGVRESAGAVRSRFDVEGRHTRLPRKLQHSGIFDIGNNQADFGRQASGLHRLDNGPAVAAGPRAENPDPGEVLAAAPVFGDFPESGTGGPPRNQGQDSDLDPEPVE